MSPIFAVLIWFNTFSPSGNTCFGSSNDCAWATEDSVPYTAAAGTLTNSLASGDVLASAVFSNGYPYRIRYCTAGQPLAATNCCEDAVVLTWDGGMTNAVLTFAAKRDKSNSPKCLTVLRMGGATAALLDVDYTASTTWRKYTVKLPYPVFDTTAELVIGWMSCTGSDTNGTWRLDNVRLDADP
jgi:hypothetical protein